MKRSSTPSRRPERRPARGPGRWLGLLLCASLASGCVSAGAHREVSDERDQLRRQVDELSRQVEILESAATSLDDERVQALDRLEDLRVERERLEAEVARLEQAEAELGETRAALEAREAEVERLRGTYDGLVEDLESEVARGQIEIQQLREGLQLNVSQEILFPSGSAELNDGGREVLRKVAARLSELPHLIEVRGHSDNLRITGSLARRYPTNWELAGARAARVVRLLESNGVSGERLKAVSKAEFEPIGDNRTPEGRSANRRIEIRLHPADSEDVSVPVQPQEPPAQGGASSDSAAESGEGA